MDEATTLDIVTFPRDAVLTVEQVAVGLGVTVEKVLKADLPTIYFGRDKRYLWGQVLDYLASKAA